jgi:hypothetical protein
MKPTLKIFDKATDLLKLPVHDVEWMDAASTSDVKLSELTDVRRHLVPRITTGRVLKDKHGVIIITDIQASGECEVWAIPKSFAPRILGKEHER